MPSSRRSFAAAVLAVAPIVACGSSPTEPTGESQQATDIVHDPYVCAPNYAWYEGEGTLQWGVAWWNTGNPVYFDSSGTAWVTYAGVENDADVEVILWVQQASQSAFEYENDICVSLPGGGSTGSSNNTGGGGGPKCAVLLAPPTNACMSPQSFDAPFCKPAIVTAPLKFCGDTQMAL